MKSRGLVFVTAFNPLCMIIVAALGSFVLAEQLHLGSIIGGFIIAMGLYSVVWGKAKDYSSDLTQPSPQQLPVTATNISILDSPEQTTHHETTSNYAHFHV